MNKKLVFQLMPDRAAEIAQQAINHTLKSGYAAKINSKEVLIELIKLLNDPKFSKYNIEFFRYDGKERVELTLDMIETALKNSIELRPTRKKDT